MLIWTGKPDKDNSSSIRHDGRVMESCPDPVIMILRSIERLGAILVGLVKDWAGEWSSEERKESS